MFRVLLIISFCSPLFLSGQEKIDWTDLDRKTGSLLSILTNPDNPNEFYALRWSGGQIFGSYKVSRHENMKKVAMNRLKIYANNSIATFEGIRVINDQLVVFLSDRRDGKNIVYMQRYDKEIKPVSEAVKIGEFDLIQGGYKGEFRIVTSENNQYFAAVWHIPGKREQHDKYGFNVYNKNFEVVNEGDYTLPFDPLLISINSHLLSDSGDYFLSMTEYKRPEERKIFGPIKEFKALHIYHIAQDGLQDFELTFEDKIVAAVAMSAKHGDIFTITGVYGLPNEDGVKGVFYKTVDLSTGNTIRQGEQEFDQDFVTQGWTERELNKAERRERRGKGEPALYNYEMKEAVIQVDGSIIGTMEQYYIEVRTSYNAQSGQNTSTYHYHYNDIIAYKIGVSGEFDWMQKIRKYQVSTNDGGPFSSYEAHIDDNKIHFIFNDNIANYSEDGSFIGEDRLYSATYTRKRNTVAIATVDLNDGTLSRSTLFDISEIHAIAVPKLFELDQQNNQLILYAIWTTSKEKFGLLKVD